MNGHAGEVIVLLLSHYTDSASCFSQCSALNTATLRILSITDLQKYLYRSHFVEAYYVVLFSL